MERDGTSVLKKRGTNGTGGHVLAKMEIKNAIWGEIELNRLSIRSKNTKKGLIWFFIQLTQEF